jgi:hypothetical protein
VKNRSRCKVHPESSSNLRVCHPSIGAMKTNIIRSGFVFATIILCAPTNSSSVDEPKEISIETTIYFPAAGCDNGVPKANWSVPTEGGPKVTCIGGQPADRLPERIVEARKDADAEYGTVILLSLSQKKLMIAADSRATWTNRNGVVVRSDDDACKVIELNPSMLFAVDGMAVTDRNLPASIYFDSRDLARAAATGFQYDAVRTNDNDMVFNVAARWGWDVDFRIRRGLEQGTLNITPTWLEGIFAGIEQNGEISVAVASLQYGKPLVGLLVPPVTLQIAVLAPPKQYTWIEAHGIKDVAEGYISKKLESEATKTKHMIIFKQMLGKEEDFPQEVLVDLINVTRDRYPTMVNGPVDVAVLPRQGKVEWLARKPVCQALWPREGLKR